MLNMQQKNEGCYFIFPHFFLTSEFQNFLTLIKIFGLLPDFLRGAIFPDFSWRVGTLLRILDSVQVKISQYISENSPPGISGRFIRSRIQSVKNIRTLRT